MSTKIANHYSVARRLELIRKFTDPAFEPFAEEYAENLKSLNAVVETLGENLEGNIFYVDKEVNFSVPHPRFLNKRRAIALAAQMFGNVIEIGFNAGHSALLMLTANPSLNLTCIDVCRHKYSVPCFKYLQSIFGDRISLIEGNSLLAMPILKSQNKEFDLYIIDGGHGLDVADSDLYNIICYSKPGSIILFDDTNMPQLRLLLDMYLMSGQLISITDPSGILMNTNQMFFINNRKE